MLNHTDTHTHMNFFLFHNPLKNDDDDDENAH